MKEYLHLFDTIEDFWCQSPHPEEKEYLVLTENGPRIKYFDGLSFGTNPGNPVTHVLDLSKLTTKNKAIAAYMDTDQNLSGSIEYFESKL